MTFSGEVLFEQTVQAKISEYTSLLLMKKALDGLPLRSNCILAATLECEGKIVCVDVKTVAEPKDLKFETPKIVIEYQISQTEFQISLTSNVYAKAVELKLNGLSAKFSDNFFDLIPMRQKIVECKTDKGISKEDFERLLVAQAYPYLEAATVNFNNKLKLV